MSTRNNSRRDSAHGCSRDICNRRIDDQAKIKVMFQAVHRAEVYG